MPVLNHPAWPYAPFFAFSVKVDPGPWNAFPLPTPMMPGFASRRSRRDPAGEGTWTSGSSRPLTCGSDGQKVVAQEQVRGPPWNLATFLSEHHLHWLLGSWHRTWDRATIFVTVAFISIFGKTIVLHSPNTFINNGHCKGLEDQMVELEPSGHFQPYNSFGGGVACQNTLMWPATLFQPILPSWLPWI